MFWRMFVSIDLTPIFGSLERFAMCLFTIGEKYCCTSRMIELGTRFSLEQATCFALFPLHVPNRLTWLMNKAG